MFFIFLNFRLDILNNENVNNETNSDNVKSSNFLQVLRDISRKRNYSQVIIHLKSLCVISDNIVLTY